MQKVIKDTFIKDIKNINDEKLKLKLSKIIKKLELFYYIFCVDESGKGDKVSEEPATKSLMGFFVLPVINFIFLIYSIKNVFSLTFINNFKNIAFFFVFISLFFAMFISFYFSNKVIDRIFDEYKNTIIDYKIARKFNIFVFTNFILFFILLFLSYLIQ